MACGELGLDINYFYRLTPRQFENIHTGYIRKQTESVKSSMLLNRQLMFTFLRPYIKNDQMTAEKMFPFKWEKESGSNVDLKSEIEVVEKENKKFWELYDKRKILA